MTSLILALATLPPVLSPEPCDPGSSHFDIKGSRVTIVKADGSNIDIGDITKAVYEVTGATMDQFRAEERSGNASVGFDDSYFPKKDDLTPVGRSELNLKKDLSQSLIVSACIAHGISLEDMTYSVGYTQRGRWVSAKRVYFNLPRNRAGTRGGSVMSAKEQLESQYMELGGDVDNALAMEDKLSERPAMLLGWYTSQVKALKASANSDDAVQAIAGATTEEKPANGIPDSSSI